MESATVNTAIQAKVFRARDAQAASSAMPLHAVQTAPAVPFRGAFIRKPRVIELTGLGSSWLYELIAQGLFPKPVKFGNRSFWVESEVMSWIEAQIAARDAQGVCHG